MQTVELESVMHHYRQIRQGGSMDAIVSFGEVLEAIETLSIDEQEALVDIVEHRLAERARQSFVIDIQAAKAEFAQGRC